MLKPSSIQGKSIEILWVFLKLGLTSFGGPIAHIGYFRRAFVQQKQWLSDSQFTELLAICQFLPGPASSQLGFAIGWQRAGWTGGLMAFIGFTLPSALIMLTAALTLTSINHPWLEPAIHGLKLVACVVVIDAVLGMYQKLCYDLPTRLISLMSAAALLLFSLTLLQMIVIFFAAIIGVFFCQTNKVSSVSSSSGINKKLSVVLLIVFSLLFLMSFMPWKSDSLIGMTSAFYQAGAMVFGGGHVVVPLLQEAMMDNSGITQQTFLTGYGIAQAIPGPMFAFSAYLGVLANTGFTAWLGAVLALLAIFVPGFLLLLVTLPFWERVQSYKHALAAMAGVNAAVVGVLGAALYNPILISSIASTRDLAIVLLGFAILTVMKKSPLWVVLWCVVASTVPFSI